MLSSLCICTIALVAVYYDTTTGKIPNLLCVYGVLTGIIKVVCLSGGSITDCMAGIALPICILFWLYRLRIIGAGDIKLLCAIGAYIGRSIVSVIVIAFIVAALVGLWRTLIRVKNYMKDRKCKCGGLNIYVLLKTSRICFSIPIAIGIFIFFIREGYFERI